ncbi:rRNA (guanine-N1)-methyltransferase [Paenibacillus glucanolyticus]|uniref:rRNA (Guanine-N1)-methyltransferase n=1 Tax=Paenibacillus glucanolyticus TaxID=59843 RepID=A0A163KH86_9BACL|nr:methyltransferase domain-containing protein [Paenibacillus glucanolyticus]KZS47222.1 rRNA (guanine-N1)-methyltransferase [Paenibacillus glucanolyticus]
MSKNEKLLQKAKLLSIHEQMFKCTICGCSMKVERLASVVCEKGHCYDISKQGHVNLLSHAVTTKYDKALFESRKRINNSGFFDPMMERITDRILQAEKSEGTELKILDAGCGEGSHLTGITNKLGKRQLEQNVLGVGMDIAKEGIMMAARNAPGHIWCTADLANSPFADKQFDFIMNILSPSNYAEFGRMLADDGMVVKVIPGSGYLQELREMFYRQTSRASYSNDSTMKLFGRHFDRMDSERIQYRVDLDSGQMRHLIHMTPLSWGGSPEVIGQTLNEEMGITVDLTVLYGWKKNQRFW